MANPSNEHFTNIGTTGGLSQPCWPDSPEQIYVRKRKSPSDRPVLIEGWIGYRIDQAMNLTRLQAKELALLLIEALLLEDG